VRSLSGALVTRDLLKSFARREIERNEETAAGTFAWCELGLQNVVLVDPAASKEAVAHHGLAKQKKEAHKDGQQKELYKS
jgi:hypothetical protein